MTLCAIVARRRRTAHRGAFGPSHIRQSHEFGMVRDNQRQIEAVGLDDAPDLLVPAAVALAVGAVFYRDEAELDRVTVGFLDLPS
jgi:hypothetical protein